VSSKLEPAALPEEVLMELPAGKHVRVVELVEVPSIHRLRARLEWPPGWISLRDLRPNGRCWAEQEGPSPTGGVGMYMLTAPVAVTSTCEPAAKQDEFIAELQPGTVVRIVEAVEMEDLQRVRARLETPAGWISLLDLQSGFRWAERQGECEVREALDSGGGQATPTSLKSLISPGGSFGTCSSISGIPAIARTEVRNGCTYWQVMLERNSNSSFGFTAVSEKLEIQRRSNGMLEGPEMLLISEIQAGGITDQWNQARSDDQDVRIFDHICNVNGKATVEAMQRELRSEKIMMRLVRYPEKFIAPMISEGGDMGCRWVSTSRLDGTGGIDANVEALRVMEIRAGGRIHSYNAHQAGLGLWQYVILSDMHVEAINSVSGFARDMMQEATSASGEISLQVRRVETTSRRLKKPPQSAFSDRSKGRLKFEEVPGLYKMTSAGIVSPSATPATARDIYEEVQAGKVVRVLEIVAMPEIERLRARIEEPPGWISLKNLETGFAWAQQQLEPTAETQATTPLATQGTLSATMFKKEATSQALDKLLAEEVVSRKNFLEEKERLQAVAEERAQGLSGDDAENCRSDAAQEAVERELLERARQEEVQEEIAQLRAATEKAEQDVAFFNTAKDTWHSTSTVETVLIPRAPLAMQASVSPNSRPPSAASSNAKPSSCCLGF